MMMDVVEAIRRVYIPEEIVTDIMTRLCDGRSIVRFRCVNKLCCRLLSDPNFINRWALWSDDNSKAEEEEKKQSTATEILIKRRRGFAGRDCFKFLYSLLSYDDVTGALGPVISTKKNNNDIGNGTSKDYKDDLEYLDLPSVPEKVREPLGLKARPRFHVVGCCDGIFCISHKVSCDLEDIILWNPTTFEVKVLPISFANRFKNSLEQLGFGFDSKTQDYKVVRTLVLASNLTTLTEVYSLKNDSWRKHDYTHNYNNIEEHNPPLRSVIQSHGSRCERVYWYNPSGRHYKGIASFDMRAEEFVNHKYPDSFRKSIKGLTDYMQLVATPRESMMVAVFGDAQRVYQIWGLLDFQVPESWTKLFTISQFSVSDTDSILGPLGKGGRYLFLKREGDLLTFNPETGETMDVPRIQTIAERCSSYDCDLQVATISFPSQTTIYFLLGAMIRIPTPSFGKKGLEPY